MRIVCAGGGPAGLYLAILLRLAGAGHEVTVLERDPAGVTYGWGVVFWDDLLQALHRADPASAGAIRSASVSWRGQQVCVGGRTVHLASRSGFAIERRRLLGILADRACRLGVDVRFGREVESAADLAGADLVAACDGAGSRLRLEHAGDLGTEIEHGRNRYAWLGTSRIFDPFTFAFERTAAGWIWFHAYRHGPAASTCIVECAPETWRGLGLDRLGTEDGLRLLERIFALHLDGHPLRSRSGGPGPMPWLGFRGVGSRTWSHGRLVLVGDAAHTTHFAVGSGTRLAMLDAIGLATALRRHPDLATALAAYEADRRRAMRETQRAARASTHWFEAVDRLAGQDPVRFAYGLWARRGGGRPWRYQLHLAMQVPVLRGLRHLLTGARRRVRAARWAAARIRTG